MAFWEAPGVGLSAPRINGTIMGKIVRYVWNANSGGSDSRARLAPGRLAPGRLAPDSRLLDIVVYSAWEAIMDIPRGLLARLLALTLGAAPALWAVDPAIGTWQLNV